MSHEMFADGAADSALPIESDLPTAAGRIVRVISRYDFDTCLTESVWSDPNQLPDLGAAQ